MRWSQLSLNASVPTPLSGSRAASVGDGAPPPLKNHSKRAPSVGMSPAFSAKVIAYCRGPAQRSVPPTQLEPGFGRISAIVPAASVGDVSADNENDGGEPAWHLCEEWQACPLGVLPGSGTGAAPAAGEQAQVRRAL